MKLRGTNHNFVKFGQSNKYCLFLAIQGGYCTPHTRLWQKHWCNNTLIGQGKKIVIWDCSYYNFVTIGLLKIEQIQAGS
jgi:hypothetical protein